MPDTTDDYIADAGTNDLELSVTCQDWVLGKRGRQTRPRLPVVGIDILALQQLPRPVMSCRQAPTSLLS